MLDSADWSEPSDLLSRNTFVADESQLLHASHCWRHEEALYARRFDRDQIRKIDLRSSREDREILASFEAVNEELTELTNEQGKLHADIEQMKIWMDGDRHESKITAFASEAMRFTERADDYEAKIAHL